MTLPRHSRAMLAATLLLLPFAGCKPDAAVEKAEVIGRGSKTPVAPPAVPLSAQNGVAPVSNAGSITGTVLLIGKSPAMATIDTSMDPACGLGGGKLTAEQTVVSNGKLANVFLYVKSGPAAALQAGPTSQQPVVLDQEGCRYVPHVVGVMQGGYIEFRNSDPTMHNIHTMPADIGNETIDVSQGPHGPPQIKQFMKPELMIPVRCNNHPWMNAFINVSATPFFAVTDANGHFELRGLPPGDYVLGAVQEKLGEKTVNVSVKANAGTRIELGYALP